MPTFGFFELPQGSPIVSWSDVAATLDVEVVGVAGRNSPTNWTSLQAAVAGADAAVTVRAVTDAIVTVADGRVVGHEPRDHLVACVFPLVARRHVLSSAPPSDPSGLMSYLATNWSVAVVE